jgi:DNA processing protein
MTDSQTISSRDRMIAYALLPFLNPARTRLLREQFGDRLEYASHGSTSFLAGLLKLSASEAALVADPLHDPAVRRAVTAERQRVITLADPDYPLLLSEIVDPPLALWTDGDRSLLGKTSIAIVGSRRASPYSVNAASKLAGDLAARGLVVVSGLARGIDAAAHSAALDAAGLTAAVLGTGIDVVYPRDNRRLFERVRQHGLLLTEFPPSTPPLAQNFPFRNRIISGLTRGTVIVEASARSGSLITARLAAEQGREVFAVPGSIFAAGSVGPHRLIQYGAKLVHDVGDILDELPEALRPEPSPVAADSPAELSDDLQRVLAACSPEEPLHIDTLAARLEQSGAALAETMLQLELRGLLRAVPGGAYVRIVK